ncbi:hypothetical protein OIU74_023943 [Salix koriyanagi]|uniref:Uncharacterized protein n=1 Tax=Salix koriyanagi TaxID=2511006 RepID=A0A9Q0WEV8_9ROSI|nr:hypothetical protein OIU74_023943 [Salix koriyanagi]
MLMMLLTTSSATHTNTGLITRTPRAAPSGKSDLLLPVFLRQRCARIEASTCSGMNIIPSDSANELIAKELIKKFGFTRVDGTKAPASAPSPALARSPALAPSPEG